MYLRMVVIVNAGSSIGSIGVTTTGTNEASAVHEIANPGGAAGNGNWGGGNGRRRRHC